ncbi:hypothetical protein [Streptomyces bottropensis]|uniref:hypothetical protein n=1 Tax=Streptomyces bottropensis TaxID=42235 RepID=UPI0036A2BA59
MSARLRDTANFDAGGMPTLQFVPSKDEPPGRARVAGYMTLIGADTANFDAAGTPTLQFVPSKDEPPGCA